MREFFRVVLRHHRLAAILCAALTLVTALVANDAAPEKWYLESVVFVQEPAAVHRLANPFAPAPNSSERELAAIPEILLSREKLVVLAKRSGLVDSWTLGRPWALRLKDRLMERIRPISEKDRLDALVAMLERKVVVWTADSRVMIAAEWSSPEVARLLVQTHLDILLQLRNEREAKTYEEAARSLDEQHEGLSSEMTARVQRIEGALEQGEWARVDREREQLMRDQTRAADLLVRAEEKHIAARVFRESNALRFRVITPPLAPKQPVGLPRLGRSVVMVLAALLAGLVCASLLGLASGRVLTGAQLEREVGLPVRSRLRFPGGAGLLVFPSRSALVLAVGLAVATGAATGLTHANPIMALLPPLAAVGGWLLWTRPLKWPLLAVMLIAVTVDDVQSRAYAGMWQSPTWPIGKLFFSNIALFTGFELMIFGLTGVMLARRLWRPARELSRIDPVHGLPPRPLQLAVLLSGLSVVLLIGWGVARGGNFRDALWQFRMLLTVPFVGMLAMYAFELPKDLPKLLAVLFTGSFVKMLLGTWFMFRVALPSGIMPPHTTGHHDTMIFVVSTVTALVLVWEHPSRRHWQLAVIWLPILVQAMRLNDRRIAYVDIGLALIFIYFLSPWHPMKRWLTRVAVFSLPAVLLYVGAGWNTQGGKLFGPVQKFRSIVAPAQASEEESSNVERDIENFNLMKTWEMNMIVGQGFGHAFREFVPSNDFSQSNFGRVGHNSILWLLWIGGIVGFTGVLLYIGVAMFFLGRTLPRATDWRERASLLVALSIFLTYLLQAFGDMGTQGVMFDFFLGTALAIIGRAATHHRVWQLTPVAPAPSVERSAVVA
ncbi:MAG: hypothetical protein ACOZQL_40060 [Myxococcota bacterium]